ncbi:MAG: hypothetical protein ACKO8I_15660 [Cyanobacteriota bacterium]
MPDLGYLVFMDKIYLLAYPLILAVLIRAIVAYHHARDAEGVELAQIQAVDRRAVAVMGIVFIVGTGIITVLR